MQNCQPFILASGDSVATALGTLAIAITIGLALGSIRIRSFRLGISGVLFSSLLFGQLGYTINPTVLSFLRDFALIVFMYSVGLQVGPGFCASMRAEGLRLNVLAFFVMAIGAAMVAAISRLLPHAMGPGVYAGAFDTTPGLAAAQEAMRGMFAGASGDAAATKTGVAYSITYPFGVIGPMLVIVLLRWMFRIQPDVEHQALAALEDKRRPKIETLDIEVTSQNYAGVSLKEHPLLREHNIVFSRLLRGDLVTVPTADTVVQVGDVYRAVGLHERLSALMTTIGKKATVDLSTAHGDIVRMDLVVTRTKVLHRTLRELNLVHRTGVTIAHINRSGIDLIPTGSLKLAFADQAVVVGPKAGIRLVEKELGNCPKRLHQSQLAPIFLGIALGVLAGSIPLAIPRLHGSLRIGLSGGSLLAALALSQLGSVGSVVWYMPAAASQLFRDFGLAIFLACVGFEAGDHFIERAIQNNALVLLIAGAIVTTVPVFLVACYARVVLRMNFISLAGWVAGAMGSSTALLFTEELTNSNTPAVAYTAVLPLSELMPIVCCQLLAILTAR